MTYPSRRKKNISAYDVMNPIFLFSVKSILGGRVCDVRNNHNSDTEVCVIRTRGFRLQIYTQALAVACSLQIYSHGVI